LEISSDALLGTGKLLLNNARFVTVTITGQVCECTLALRPGFVLRKMLGTRFGFVGTRFR